ncbi:MAG: CmpA/NrtA family ABC transporter substrate-binding protein [Stappiaceae bacterium]
MHQIVAGFIPLIDASVLIVAREKGFAETEGIDLHLVRETSWANIRDRLSIGHFDVAHMLAPMPLASNLGLTPFDQRIYAPMALGLGGNAVTVSPELLDACGLEVANGPTDAVNQLKKIVKNRNENGEAKLRLGVVHPFSSHNLELRYWLAAGGIQPDNDIDILILPPSLMADALAARRLDGYCVGEPWNSVALASGTGQVLTTKHAIWASSPEKVLGVPASVIDAHPEAVAALLRACYASARWCTHQDNRTELAQILTRPDYLALEQPIVEAALSGEAGFEPFEKAATFPWQSHALWFYTQMVRWGMLEHTGTSAETALRTYRPDLYRSALADIGAVLPSASSKVEGALREAVPVGATGGALILGPDGFFDGRTFDPDQVDAYIESQRSAS